MLIWLLRHGMTACTSEGRYQGRLDTSLSTTGRRALKQADFSPPLVYVSARRRTAETAAILFPDARQVIVPGLEEMDFGAFEGKNFQDLASDVRYREWVERDCLDACPGGECRADFIRRCCNAFAQLLEESRAKSTQKLVIVAHGGTQMAILSRWAVPARDYFQWGTPPGAGYLLDDSGWPKQLTVLHTVHFNGGNP